MGIFLQGDGTGHSATLFVSNDTLGLVAAAPRHSDRRRGGRERTKTDGVLRGHGNCSGMPSLRLCGRGCGRRSSVYFGDDEKSCGASREVLRPSMTASAAAVAAALSRDEVGGVVWGAASGRERGK